MLTNRLPSRPLQAAEAAALRRRREQEAEEQRRLAEELERNRTLAEALYNASLSGAPEGAIGRSFSLLAFAVFVVLPMLAQAVLLDW